MNYLFVRIYIYIYDSFYFVPCPDSPPVSRQFGQPIGFSMDLVRIQYGFSTDSVRI
jgi:hypothetical protein